VYDNFVKKTKTSRQLERHFKGIANHRRLEIIFLVDKSNGITLEEIADSLKCDFRTISEHTKKLVYAGLLNKKYQGRNVSHFLSPYGREILKFIRTFQYS